MNHIIKKQTIYILALIFVALQLFFNRNQLLKIFLIPTNTPTPTITIVPYEKQLVKVLYVIDGDTIIIDGNKKVRYIGINTPEMTDPRLGMRPKYDCFAKEAFNENSRLLAGKMVYLEKDVSETDKYGRLLRYIWVGDTFVNDYLVRQGFANVSTFPPDVKYVSQFLEAQKEAQENKRGLWKECPTK